MAYPQPLHPEYFNIPIDRGIGNALEKQLGEAPIAPFEGGRPPEMTVLIQSVCDTPTELGRVLTDIDANAEVYGDPARVKKVVVIGGSAWKGTPETAKEHGAEVRKVEVTADFRSRIIREGLDAAESDIVYTTVGHAQLTNEFTLTTAAHHASQPDFGGAFGLPLRGSRSTLPEWIGARLLGLDAKVRKGVMTMPKKLSVLGGMGLMGADCSVLKPSVVKRLGGFDQSFGFGGADGRFGQLALREGLTVTRDPLLSVFHTDQLNVGNSLRLVNAWLKMGTDQPYRPAEWDWHPHGGL